MRRGDGRVEHVERVEGDGGFLTQRRRDAECAEGWPCRTCRTCRGGEDFLTQRRRVRKGDGRVEHVVVVRVEGEW